MAPKAAKGACLLGWFKSGCLSPGADACAQQCTGLPGAGAHFPRQSSARRGARRARGPGAHDQQDDGHRSAWLLYSRSSVRRTTGPRPDGGTRGARGARGTAARGQQHAGLDQPGAGTLASSPQDCQALALEAFEAPELMLSSTLGLISLRSAWGGCVRQSLQQFDSLAAFNNALNQPVA